MVHATEVEKSGLLQREPKHSKEPCVLDDMGGGPVFPRGDKNQ